MTTQNTIPVAVGTSAAKIQDIIDSADEGTTLVFEAGTFIIDQSIVIDRSGISIEGAGAGQTIFVADPALGAAPAIQIGHGVYGSNVDATYHLAQDASEGDTQIVLEDGHGLVAGDTIFLTQENTDEFFEEIGDEHWLKDKPLQNYLVRVTEVNGNTVTLENGLTFDFDADLTEVEDRALLTDNSLSGFTMQGGWGEPDASDFSNTEPEAWRMPMILLGGTDGTSISHIEILDAASHGIEATNATDLDIDDILIDGALNKGAGGNGYGIHLRDVFDSSFTNLEIFDTRHAVVFASYHSATGNHVEVDSTNRDINFHGGRDHDNDVMVHESIRSGDEQAYMAQVLFFNEGTTYGAPTEADDNWVEFGKVQGTVRGDLVYSAEYGSDIKTYGSADTIITRGGDDRVDAGTGHDTIYASGGTDVLDGGSGTDTVIFSHDFDTYTTAWDQNVLHVSRDGSTTELHNVEELVFSDTGYAIGDVPEQTASDTATDGSQQAPDVPDTAPDAPDDTPTDQPVEQPVDTPETTPEPDTGGLIAELSDPNGTIVTGSDGWERASVYKDTIMGDKLDALRIEADSGLTAIGNNLDNHVMGGRGDDWIEGRFGNDRVFGGKGDDTILGGAGNDEIFGGSGADILSGGAGSDLVEGGSGNDTIYASDGTDKLDGGAGTDTIIFAEAFDAYTTQWTDGTLFVSRGDSTTELQNVEHLTFSDVAYAIGDVPEHTAGGSQTGGGSAQTPDDPTDTPDDTGGALPDQPVEQPVEQPTEQPETPAAQEPLFAERSISDIATVDGANGWERITVFEDTLMGDDLDATALSSDTGLTNIGNDLDNHVMGSKGHDWIEGGLGDDRMFGRVGRDTILGGDGDDEIFGGKGADVLLGGDGNDYLEGGKGRDLFVGTEGNNVIADFSAAEGDRIAFNSEGITDFMQALDVYAQTGVMPDEYAVTLVDLDGIESTRIENDEGENLTVAGLGLDDLFL